MVKHTQTIRRQKPTNCLSVFDHFLGLTLKGLMANFNFYAVSILSVKEWAHNFRGKASIALRGYREEIHKVSLLTRKTSRSLIKSVVSEIEMSGEVYSMRVIWPIT